MVMPPAVSGSETFHALIAAIATGDRDAFSRFYDLAAPLAYGLIRRVLRDPDAAAEVLQEVLWQVWKEAAQYDPKRGSPEAWLVMRAKTRAIDRLRSMRRRDRTFVAPVDESVARRDDPPVRFDRLTRGSAEPSQLDDLAFRHADVAVEGGTSGSVDDASVLDQEVVGHLVAPFAGTTVAGTRAVIHPRDSRRAGARLGWDGSSEARPLIDEDFTRHRGRPDPP